MPATSRLWSAYWWLERRLAPGVRYAQEDFEERLFATVTSGSDWLDLGCGHALLPEWRATREKEILGRPRLLVGLDPELSALEKHRGIRLRVCGDGGTLPFADGAFDLVTANMVVEHLAAPEAQFREIARILRPGGRFLFHTPNASGYPTLMARMVPDPVRALGAWIVENRGSEDRFRTYYRANSPPSIDRIAERAGFVVESVELVRSNAMFPLVTPVAAVELLFIRALARPRLSWLRPNLIAILRKPLGNGDRRS